VTEDATARRQLLGRTLRQLRTEAGFTQTAVARRLDCGQAKINKIERTLVSISLPDLDKLIDVYGVPETKAAELRALATQDHQNGPARTTMSAFTELSDRELEAAEIYCWHSERIPLPLQAETYTIRQWGPNVTNHQVLEVLRARAARMQVLSKPDPPWYRVVLSESSLHRMPGGRTADMVDDQARHLLELMAEHKRLEVRILPFEADVPYVDSDFQLLLSEDQTFSNFAYLEYPGGSLVRRKACELAEFQAHWAALNTAALDLAETREFLGQLRK
jgi:transcriptional regulator with XRE-family HTH domain